VYVLVEGEVRTSVSTEEGSEHTTLLYGAPAMFGDRDLLANLAAEETATALTACQLLLFDRAALIEAYAAEGWMLTADLACRYAATVAWERLSQAPLAARLAVLLRDCEALPSQAYLAEALGAAPKSIGRALVTLREQAILSESSAAFAIDCERLGALGIAGTDRAFHRFRESPNG
jgi:CRP-like cAMP-binding protein